MTACATGNDGAGTTQGTDPGSDRGDPTTQAPDPVTTPDPTTTADQNDHPEPQEGIVRLGVGSDFVKLLDERMEKTQEGITCDWSCAGIEFTADCAGTLTLDLSVDTKKGCYFRVWVDGAEWKNGDTPYYDCQPGSAKIEISGISSGSHTFRIVKVTEYGIARALLKSISLEGGTVAATAPAKNARYIEYIGANAFCGWGVVATPWGAYTGSYQSMDGTLATPYLVSNALNADLSVVALSEQGIASGTPGLETAYKYASYLRSTANEYSFARRADAVVIDSGILDTQAGKGATEASFSAAYKRLLEYVRAKHGTNCVILSVYNTAGDGYKGAIKSVVEELGGESAGYYLFKTDRCSAAHTEYPTAEEHTQYATVISAMLKSVFDGTYTPPVYDTSRVNLVDEMLNKEMMKTVEWEVPQGGVSGTLNVLALGDSLFNGSTESGYEKQWLALLAKKNDWNLTNLGWSGATVACNPEADSVSVPKSIYYQLFNNPDYCYGTTSETTIHYTYGDCSGGAESVDIVFLEGGVNDWHNIPLGTVDSTDPSNLYGARHLIVERLLEQYPNAKIVLVTTWYVQATRSDGGERMDFVANSIYEMYNEFYAENDRVCILDAGNPVVSGVDMSDNSWRAQYCPEDLSHLNDAGMEFVANALDPLIEKIVKEPISNGIYVPPTSGTSPTPPDETSRVTLVEGTLSKENMPCVSW